MTPGQCRAARILLGWTQDELAKRSGINRDSVTRFEGGQRVSDSLQHKLERTLARAGIRFVEDWGVSYREKRRRKTSGAKRRS